MPRERTTIPFGQAVVMTRPRGTLDIAWCGYVFAAAGFDDELRNFLAAVETHCPRIRQRLIPLSERSTSCPLEERTLSLMRRLMARKPRGKSVYLFHLYMANIAALAAAREFLTYPQASGSIVRTMFEPDRLLPSWVAYLNRFDEIWVPSEFNRMSFAASGIAPEKIVTLPETIDLGLYDPRTVRPFPAFCKKDKFVFLSILPANRQHMRLRKGIEILLKAYMDEFEEGENATLVLHLPEAPAGRSGPASCVKALEADLHVKIAHRKDIVLHRRVLSGRELPRLYRSADAFVLPSRGEAWGRLYMEAMAMGLPTLGTRWGGNLDFMNDRNSFLIDCRLIDIPRTQDMPDYWRREDVPLRWADPSAEHLRDLMRFVFKNRTAANKRGQRARRDIGSKFNARAVARLIDKNLRRFVRGRA